MVSVTSLGLAQLRAGLANAATLPHEAPLHHKALSLWLGGGSADELEAVAALARGNLENAASRSVRDVATLGFASLVTGSTIAFCEGLEWLGHRTWFQPQRPMTLEADGVAALGLALAISNHSLECPVWLSNLVTRSASSLPLDSFSRSLFIVAAHVVNAPAKLDQGELIPEVRVVFGGSAGITVSDDVYARAWEALRTATANAGEEVEALLRLKALDLVADHSIPARLGKLEPKDVVRVLEGVSRSLRRWTWETKPKTPRSSAVRWQVQNEYHVQNLLYAILAPLFSDLNDEETIPPVGQKSPRLDLTISSIGTIVEVKFLRTGIPMQKIIDEIAADVGLYKTDPRWTYLIPFIWDESARTEEHAKLVSGLCQMDMVIGAIVVPRPGKMISTSGTTEP
jgi:hypothetical protein